jgi:hypothetical protein
MPSTLSKYSDDEESTDGILHSEEQENELDNTQSDAVGDYSEEDEDGDDDGNDDAKVKEDNVASAGKKFYQSYAPYKYFVSKQDAMKGLKI